MIPAFAGTGPPAFAGTSPLASAGTGPPAFAGTSPVLSQGKIYSLLRDRWRGQHAYRYTAVFLALISYAIPSHHGSRF